MGLIATVKDYMHERASQRHLALLRQNVWEGLIPGHVVRYTGNIPDYVRLTLIFKGLTQGEAPEPYFREFPCDPDITYFLARQDDYHPGMLPLFHTKDYPTMPGIRLLSATRGDFEVIGFATPPKLDRVAKQLREELAGQASH